MARTDDEITAQVNELMARSKRRLEGKSTPGDMAHEVAEEIEGLVDTLDGVGVDSEGFDEMGWDESYRDRVRQVMRHIETAGYHLNRAHQEMKTIAEEIRGKETQDGE